MTATPPELAEVHVNAAGLTITLLDGTVYAAAFNFTEPMEQRTCTEGNLGKALPNVTVTDTAGKVTHWHPAGRANLPDVVNDAVADHFKDLVARVHHQAEYLGLLPVPESVVRQFRQEGPDATVMEIREADRIHRSMVEDLGMGSRRTALWMARFIADGYIGQSKHNEIVSDLESEIQGLEDKGKEVESCSCPEPTEDPGVAGLLNAVELLRTQGAKVLEFRAGRDDVEKVIDLLDAA